MIFEIETYCTWDILIVLQVWLSHQIGTIDLGEILMWGTLGININLKTGLLLDYNCIQITMWSNLASQPALEI